MKLADEMARPAGAEQRHLCVVAILGTEPLGGARHQLVVGAGHWGGSPWLLCLGKRCFAAACAAPGALGALRVRGVAEARLALASALDAERESQSDGRHSGEHTRRNRLRAHAAQARPVGVSSAESQRDLAFVRLPLSAQEFRSFPELPVRLDASLVPGGLSSGLVVPRADGGPCRFADTRFQPSVKLIGARPRRIRSRNSDAWSHCPHTENCRRQVGRAQTARRAQSIRRR